MKKPKTINLFIIYFLILLIFLLSACIQSDSTMFFTYYNSKTYLQKNKFSVGMVKVLDEKNFTYKLREEHTEDFEKNIIKLKEFCFKDKVRDYIEGKNIYNNLDAYILTNGDSYFAVGKNKEGYYEIRELVAYIIYSKGATANGYQKEFTIPPYFYNFRYRTQSIEEGLHISMGEKVNIPYDWDYLKSFYSKLEYAKIDEEQKKITINCYTVITDTDINYGREEIQTLDIVYSKENGNNITFVVE